MVYAFEHDIFAALFRIGKLTNSKIKKEVIICLSQLLDANDDEFSGRNIVLNCLNHIALDYYPDPEYDANLVYLLFSISTFLKSNPSLLHKLLENKAYHIAYRTPSKEQSPAFHALLNYTHFDGATGDFARTGILNFVEVLVKEPQFQDWVESNGLPEVMAAGLGALFSQLTRYHLFRGRLHYSYKLGIWQFSPKQTPILLRRYCSRRKSILRLISLPVITQTFWRSYILLVPI